MKANKERPLGVTLAFAVGATLMFVVLLTFYGSGAGGDAARGAQDWAALASSTIGTAILAGIVVDALRWIGTHLWSEADEFPRPDGKAVG